jgi:hypothetical protein
LSDGKQPCRPADWIESSKLVKDKSNLQKEIEAFQPILKDQFSIKQVKVI